MYSVLAKTTAPYICMSPYASVSIHTIVCYVPSDFSISKIYYFVPGRAHSHCHVELIVNL